MSFTDILLSDDDRNKKILREDPLANKLKKRQQKEAIERSANLGKKYAAWLNENYGNSSIERIFKGLELKVKYNKNLNENLSPYSIYYPKTSTILVNVDIIQKLVAYLKEYSSIENWDELSMRVSNVIYYHELFHHLEEKFGKASKLHKVKVVDFKVFSLSSGIRALSEIGAHTFARETVEDVEKYIGISKKELL